MEKQNYPHHVAIIMDGNGRWAKNRGLARNFGHRQGAENLATIARHANKIGISMLTVYAFSTENWSRPKEEVNFLMKLPQEFFKKYSKSFHEDNIRLRFIGERTRLGTELCTLMSDLEHKTHNNTGLLFTIALNYGGRDEIIRAIAKAQTANIPITEANMPSFLDTYDIPDVDLMIRTSGEERISNFLLWQSAYSELYFTNILWPDFSPADFDQAMAHYQQRSRRFGGLR
ncbi:MAG: isoprenyl transferase [Bacilli bacterium]|jgi:undecaprenyl diphosphate synthase|nr:isoprenyl transferase [Bacilli bacterium]